jgi:hypothetical protein
MGVGTGFASVGCILVGGHGQVGVSSGGWLKRLHDRWLNSHLVDASLSLVILLAGAYTFWGWFGFAVVATFLIVAAVALGALFVLLWLVAAICRCL